MKKICAATANNTTHAGRKAAPNCRNAMVPHVCPVASHVVSFGTPSGWPSHVLDIAATSACAERYATICKPRKQENARAKKRMFGFLINKL
jgi:hypothetical protein